MATLQPLYWSTLRARLLLVSLFHVNFISTLNILNRMDVRVTICQSWVLGTCVLCHQSTNMLWVQDYQGKKKYPDKYPGSSLGSCSKWSRTPLLHPASVTEAKFSSQNLPSTDDGESSCLPLAATLEHVNNTTYPHFLSYLHFLLQYSTVHE